MTSPQPASYPANLTRRCRVGFAILLTVVAVGVAGLSFLLLLVSPMACDNPDSELCHRVGALWPEFLASIIVSPTAAVIHLIVACTRTARRVIACTRLIAVALLVAAIACGYWFTGSDLS